MNNSADTGRYQLTVFNGYGVECPVGRFSVIDAAEFIGELTDGGFGYCIQDTETQQIITKVFKKVSDT